MSALALGSGDRARELRVRGIEKGELDLNTVSHDYGCNLLLHIVDYGLCGGVDQDWICA
jgi:hypothetical protein